MATTYSMSVHKGLAELKILAQRIEKQIRSTTFVTTNKHANAKIDGKTIADVKKDMKADYQKVVDLIARRDAIKRAITASNAKTSVTLTDPNGKTITMTVAELIEYKAVGIQYLDMLRKTIASQYNEATRTIEYNNGDYIEDRADKHVAAVLGNTKDGIDKDTVAATRNSFIEANTIDLIDPNNVSSILDDLEEKITFYQTEVDAALSASNAVTQIEFTV